MSIRSINRASGTGTLRSVTPHSVDIICDAAATDQLKYKDATNTVRTIVNTDEAQTLTNKTLTAPSFASPIITGSAGTGFRIVKQALFTEDATSLTHTATFAIPAGALLVDIWAVPQVLWTGGTAKLDVGDAGSAIGYFNALDLKATDLVLGERLQASNANNWGGKNGAYLTTAGRFGLQATNCIGGYCVSAYSVLAVVTVGTPATTAGRLRVYVEYMVGESVVPVLA